VTDVEPAIDRLRPSSPPTAPCVLCHGRKTLLWDDCTDLEYFMTGSGDMYRCEACGLVAMEPMPTRQELPALYPPGYYNLSERKSALARFLQRRYHQRQAGICRSFLPPDGRILEIGCATGDVLVGLRDDYPVVHGVDLSDAACEVARRRGLEVFCGTLEEYETDQQYDVVFMSHIIEHVIDPVATVAAVERLLAPGGVLYIETPNVGSLDARVWKQRWGLIHYPRHLYLFDRDTISSLLTSSSLATEHVRWEPNSCGWALSVQSELRRRQIDRATTPRSWYYPLLLMLFLPFNLVDTRFGGTAFMSVIGRKAQG
jgi:2-polyprenyl-3-methyl-5-hydroxy-6-metoxy-1,4-benzoquinol methylase